MSLPSDSDAQQVENTGPRTRGRWRRPSSWLEGQWLPLMNRGRREIWAALGPVTVKLPILQPGAWPHPLCCQWRRLASVHGHERTAVCRKSRMCRSTVMGACLLLSSLRPCTARGWQSRNSVGSRAEAKGKMP